MSDSSLRTDQLPALDSSRPVVRVSPQRRMEAVGRLLGSIPGHDAAPAERFVAYAREHEVALDAMWARLSPSGAIEATVLAVPNPGRTAILFASPLADRTRVAELGALIRHVVTALPALDIDLAQVLLEPGETRLREAFALGGFSVLAQLSYLERPLPRRKPPVTLPEDVDLAPFGEEHELAQILEASYEGTRDCPGLRGLRRTQDIMAGHRGTGAFDPCLWTILRIRGRGAGALLLNRAPASNTVELVYIGLAPAARGRGLGRLLLRHGLGLVAGGRERAITLAVDDDNAPAIALYRREGFRRTLRRLAMIHPLRTAES